MTWSFATMSSCVAILEKTSGISTPPGLMMKYFDFTLPGFLRLISN